MPLDFIRESTHSSVTPDNLVRKADSIENLPVNIRHLYTTLNRCKQVSAGYQNEKWLYLKNENGDTGIYDSELVDQVLKGEDVCYIAKSGEPLLVVNSDGVFLIASAEL